MVEYNNTLDLILIIIAFITLLVIISGFHFWKDRKAMREEIKEDAKKAVEKDAREVINKAKVELARFSQKLKEETDKEMRKVKDKGKEAEEITEKIREFGKAVLAKPTPPVGVETNKEKEVRDLLGRGNKFLDKEDFDTAIYNYTKAIDKNPNYAAAFNNRGNTYYNKKDCDTAIRDFNKAIELDPNYAAAFYNRGNAYADKKDYDTAIRDFDKAIELDPKLAIAFNNRGVAYYHKKDYDAAIRDYERALKLFTEMGAEEEIEIVKENIAEIKAKQK